MKVLIRLFPVFVFISQFTMHFAAAETQRTALVIGNSAYSSAPLKNPVNDANDMASLLEKLDFAVIKRLDASKRDMEEAIYDLGRKLKKGGVGLFYFAGHGVQVQGFNYLIPVGANIETEGDVQYEAVNANRVLRRCRTPEILSISFFWMPAGTTLSPAASDRRHGKGLPPWTHPRALWSRLPLLPAMSPQTEQAATGYSPSAFWKICGSLWRSAL